MKIAFGNLGLATDDLATGLISGSLTVNGQQVNDEAQFIRALASTFFPRGNRSATISFVASVSHATQRIAERKLLTYFWDLPQQEDLRFWCGPMGDQEIVSFLDAVIDSAACGPVRGITGAFRYSFKVSSPVTEYPPPELTEPTSDMLKRGTTTIAAAADHIDVAFSPPFSAPPAAVVASIQRPAAGDQLWAIVRDATVTANGFTADLSAPAPASGYKLSWIACA
jgi:hypothetical protein